MSILDQNLLTLDFSQDNVTYGSQTVPAGSVGCAVLNITGEQISTLTKLCQPLQQIIAMVGLGVVNETVFSAAEESVLSITKMLRQIEPFSMLDFPADGHDIHTIFSKPYLENLKAYIKAAQEIGAAAAFDPQYSRGVGVLKLIQVMAQLGGTLQIYLQEMTAFARNLHASKRTPEAYADVFAEQYADLDLVSPQNPLWMSMSNMTVQYLTTQTKPPQIVRRMHYVSFVGLLRSDLFEGLRVGHAPRLCPICGKWFLTTDARHTKYCGGLAPGDKRGRTCRQIGNLKGRAQRELADDHPIKAIYTRRMNTITQYCRRGTLDKQTADKMKRLAKNKMERAIFDPVYAKGNYIAEMTQDALVKEVGI